MFSFDSRSIGAVSDLIPPKTMNDNLGKVSGGLFSWICRSRQTRPHIPKRVKHQMYAGSRVFSQPFTQIAITQASV